MPKRDIFDDVIEILERRRQQQGNGRLYLPADTRHLLFDADAPPEESDISSRVEPASASSPKPASEQLATASASPGPSSSSSASPRAATDAPIPDADNLDWQSLRETVSGCDLCRLGSGRTQTVFGEGKQNAEIMFIGEAPGYHEDQSGRPCAGPAGQLLTRMIKAMQLTREDVYIANIVKCRPPASRNPMESEAATCIHYLKRQIELVKPSVLVLLGSAALEQLLNKKDICKLHGQWMEYEGIPTLPTFHPSILLHSPQRKRETWEDLQKVMKRLGKDPEKTMEEMRRQKEKARQQSAAGPSE